MYTINRLESQVRSYSRTWPAVFSRAAGHVLVDEGGKEYIDFFAGAGALNYGHNPPMLQDALIEYIRSGAVTHSLDMATPAKRDFLVRFEDVILKPRDLRYKIQFPGPTGTNSVEAALKIARKVTGRNQIVGFTNAFHGMTLGSLAVTGNSLKRSGAGVSLTDATPMPYEGYMGDSVDSLEYIEGMLTDSGSGLEAPAAVIVESVQAEGGLATASMEWLKRLERLCRSHDMLLIVDDIQTGCGRTGKFFSFEDAGIEPDIVCLSKSLSGYGLPFAVTLIKPEHDVWDPGEHNGTFRGHNPAMVTATAALNFWQTAQLSEDVERKAEVIGRTLDSLLAQHPAVFEERRGRGLIQGLACREAPFASKISRAAFDRGLIIETSGPESEVVKLLPPLTIDDDGLETGLQILADSIDAVADEDLAMSIEPNAEIGHK